MLFLSSPRGVGIAPTIELSVVIGTAVPVLSFPRFHGFGQTNRRPPSCSLRKKQPLPVAAERRSEKTAWLPGRNVTLFGGVSVKIRPPLPSATSRPVVALNRCCMANPTGWATRCPSQMKRLSIVLGCMGVFCAKWHFHASESHASERTDIASAGDSPPLAFLQHSRCASRGQTGTSL